VNPVRRPCFESRRCPETGCRAPVSVTWHASSYSALVSVLYLLPRIGCACNRPPSSRAWRRVGWLRVQVSALRNPARKTLLETYALIMASVIL
jgi:hypothetical protein